MESLPDAMEIQLCISPLSLGVQISTAIISGGNWRKGKKCQWRDTSLPLLYAFGAIRGSGPFPSPCRLDGEIL